MNVAVLKTKAEAALAEQFAAVAAKLPGGKDAAKLREQALGQFAGVGLPTRRVEEWKYTDLRALTKEALAPAAADVAASDAADAARALTAGLDAVTFVFVDGRLVSSAQGDFTGVSVKSLADALSSDARYLAPALPGTVDPGQRNVIALNTAYVTDGAVIDIASGAKPAKPIHLVFVASGRLPQAVTTRNIVSIGDNAEATVIETHFSAGAAPRQENALTIVQLKPSAKIVHIKRLQCGLGTQHLGNWIADIAAGATYTPFQMTTGAGIARHQMTVTFSGEHASFDLGSAFLIDGQGHCDTTLVVDHAVPHCTSRELVKGVLDDQGRGIFQGKVIVRPGAQKTDGKQMAKALMLSPDAEFDSKPELEIYADDVVCGHGSTAAELDEDLLFYCRSRGIPLEEARSLMVASFIGEAIDKVEDESIRSWLAAGARAWLVRA